MVHSSTVARLTVAGWSGLHGDEGKGVSPVKYAITEWMWQGVGMGRAVVLDHFLYASRVAPTPVFTPSHPKLLRISPQTSCVCRSHPLQQQPVPWAHALPRPSHRKRCTRHCKASPACLPGHGGKSGEREGRSGRWRKQGDGLNGGSEAAQGEVKRSAAGISVQALATTLFLYLAALLISAKSQLPCFVTSTLMRPPPSPPRPTWLANCVQVEGE